MTTTITAQLTAATSNFHITGHPFAYLGTRAQFAAYHFAAAYLTASIGHDELTTDDLPALRAESDFQQAELDSYRAAARRLNGKDGREPVLDSDLVDDDTRDLIELGRERVKMEAEAIIRLATTAIRELSDF